MQAEQTLASPAAEAAGSAAAAVYPFRRLTSARYASLHRMIATFAVACVIAHPAVAQETGTVTVASRTGRAAHRWQMQLQLSTAMWTGTRRMW